MTEADCLFCRIVNHQVPAEIVAESESAVAFRDINPQAPTHVLVVPREHYRDVAAVAADDPHLLAATYAFAADVARTEGLPAYRMVTNSGAEAGQSVFHLHVHVLGGRPLTWPPG